MELPHGASRNDTVEVRFKNTRKEYFKCPDDLTAVSGEAVVVEGMSGYDIGVVSLTGELVGLQMKRHRASVEGRDMRKILRKPNQEELDRWAEARGMESDTMIEARGLAKELNLQMKISDVEYQADRSKATFFYTADDRVDFRELIKRLAERFKIRVEMRQIGARQEAGRLGGIGSCGRELCCSTWLSDFRSVSTAAARYQQLAINPLKLAGQCGKLKCCLNFELDSYKEAVKSFPSTDVKLQLKTGVAYHAKSDIFKGLMWYSTRDGNISKFYCLEVDRVHEIIAMNKEGKKPETLGDFEFEEELKKEAVVEDYGNVVGQDDLTRFDQKSKGKRRRGKGKSTGAKKQGEGDKSRRPRSNNKRKPKAAANAPKKATDGKPKASGDNNTGAGKGKRPAQRRRRRRPGGSDKSQKPSE